MFSLSSNGTESTSGSLSVVLSVSESYVNYELLSCCLTSTEARWPIRDGDRVGRGQSGKGTRE